MWAIKNNGLLKQRNIPSPLAIKEVFECSTPLKNCLCKMSNGDVYNRANPGDKDITLN